MTAGVAVPLPRNLVGLKVVVVDDDDASLDYFAVALGACGAEVMTATTAVDPEVLCRTIGTIAGR